MRQAGAVWSTERAGAIEMYLLRTPYLEVLCNIECIERTTYMYLTWYHSRLEIWLSDLQFARPTIYVDGDMYVYTVDRYGASIGRIICHVVWPVNNMQASD